MTQEAGDPAAQRAPRALAGVELVRRPDHQARGRQALRQGDIQRGRVRAQRVQRGDQAGTCRGAEGKEVRTG